MRRALVIAAAWLGCSGPSTAPVAPTDPPTPARAGPAPAASRPPSPAEAATKPDSPPDKDSADDPCAADASTVDCKCSRGDIDACLGAAKTSFRRGDHNVAIVSTVALCERKAARGCFDAADYMDKRHIPKRLGKTPAELRQRGVALYREGCEAGDPSACFHYGTLLLAGKHVDVDVALGKKHLESSCSAGHAGACAFLAMAHDLGTSGLKKNKKRALELFEAACNAGKASSCTILADKIARRDRKRAAALYARACDGDDGTGCDRLAWRLSRARKYESAFATYVKACKLGDSAASCVSAGRLAETGKGTSMSPVEARKLYRIACDDNVGEGCAALAALIAKGSGGQRNWGRAVELYDQSCSVGYKRGCTRGTKLRHKPPSWKCASETECLNRCDEHLGKACAKLGDMRAQRETAELMRTQASDDQLRDQTCASAHDAYELGCTYGHGQSCLRLGDYDRACKAGSKIGCVQVAVQEHDDGMASLAEKQGFERSLAKQCARGKNARACIAYNRVVYGDETAARSLATACKRKSGRACLELAHHPDVGRVKLDWLADSEASWSQPPDASERLIERACQLESLQACFSDVSDETVDAAMKARWRHLLANQSCGRDALVD